MGHFLNSYISSIANANDVIILTVPTVNTTRLIKQGAVFGENDDKEHKMVRKSLESSLGHFAFIKQSFSSSLACL